MILLNSVLTLSLSRWYPGTTLKNPQLAAEDGWQLQIILLGDELPAASEADAPLRSRLLALLEEKLAVCKRGT